MSKVSLTQIIKQYQHLELLEFQPKIAIILGNGPSSKLLNFELLQGSHIATVGMNAAYRYWNEIDFRPTYYICMDIVVIQSHADVIYKLIHERRIKKFFLRDEIKDIYPDIRDLDHIFWYSQAVKEYEIFQTNYITTGSWAIRWMAYEQIKIIATIGIDANYVEVLPESQKIGLSNDDLRLQISQTPNFNPNYFFNKYQQAGDKYNIPNDPNYVKKNNGHLVHIDSLKEVSESIKWLEIESKIYDLSSISSHGIFEKMPSQQFFDRLKLSVVTSFRQESSISVAIKINIEMLILNISNPFVREIFLLFEGCWTSFESELPLDQQMFFKQAIKNKKLYVTETSDRPSYWQLFNLANQFGKGLYIIMNSDIYLPAISAEKLIIDSFLTTDQFYALTRWNLTSNGTFLQSVTPSPPWSEIKFSDLSRKDKNYFSYDTYCFNAPISIPESTRKVLLGSYGCDSAIAAIFKSSGFMVSNPCLHYQFIHVDDKPRNYQSNQSRNDLILNVDAVTETIRKKWDKSLIGKSLEYLPSLRRYVAWIGHSGAINPWQAIYRVLGATPWSNSIFPKEMNFKKISLTSQQLDSANLSFDPEKLLREIENREIFLEWELSGFETPEHVVQLLSKNQSCTILSDCLSTYPWISMVHIDKASPEEVSAVFDVIVLIKEYLMNYSLHTTYTDSVFPVILDTPKVITNGKVELQKIQYLFTEIGPDNNVMFRFDRIIKPGNVAKATIRLSGEINSKLVIILCRDGRTPYEGQNKNVLLTGESQEFDIIHCFDKKHKGIRIQIYSPDHIITISDVNVVVTIEDSKKKELFTPLAESCLVDSLFSRILNENSNVSQQSLMIKKNSENTNTINLITHETRKSLTIALSCYKADNYIDGYIDCLKNQENIDEILLVVFDYPLSHADSQRVKEVIHQLDNSTVLYIDRGNIKEDLYTAWNQIFSLSNTEYIANLNVDDRVSQDYFDLAIKTLDGLNLDVFSTNAIALSIAGDLSSEIYRHRHFDEGEFNESMVKIYGLKEFAQVYGGYFKKKNPPHCVPVWRLNWHKRIGDFNPSKFDWCSDYEYWLRMAAAGAKFGVHNTFKTYFLSATGTASDRLYLQDNQSVIENWKISFPLAGYKETSLGKNHDLMHHCFNLHTYFSSREYFYNQKDLVSIVVLYHKIDDYLAECIKSIQSQDYPLFECVLVFDNDPESKIQHYCRSLVGDDLRFRFVSLGQKCERNYARNVGIELAIGDYITIVDGDDMLPRDSLSKRLNYISKLPSESKKIVFGGFRCFRQDGEESICRGRDSYNFETFRLDVITHCGVMFPAKLLKQKRYKTNRLDLLMPSFKIGGEDVDFMISFLKENPGYEYINCNSITYDYRYLTGTSHDKRCWPVFGMLNVLIKHYGLPKETDQDYKISFARRLLEFRLWADYLKRKGEEIPNLPFSEDQEKTLLRCLNHSQKESVFKNFTNVLNKHGKDNNDTSCHIVDALHKEFIKNDQLQSTILGGPYSREQKAHIDETAIIAKLTSQNSSEGIMIDVGAHIGTALAPFLDQNWKIFAFEPDDNNRAKLLEFLNKHKGKELVTIDTRCVSNKSQQNIPFYRSEQSTGISGLSAFHESHIEAQRVDTISLKDFFQDKPLPTIDFLKIDTEGNDLFVLQGFPWERCKPSIIECEFEDIKTVPLGYTFHDLARFLVEKGYTVYVSEWHPIIRYGIRHDWNGIRLYPCELADTKGWGNLLAFLDPIDEKALIDAVTKVLKLNPEKQSKPMAGLVSESLNMPNISSTISIRFHELSCSSYFTALSEKTWRYTHPGKDVPENLWIVAFDIFDSTLDRGYISGIRLMSNKKMTIRVTLGRQGNTEWEGSIQKVHLLPHIAQSVQVHHKFVKQHWEVKLQVEVLEVEDGNIADLTFDDIYVHESLDSLRQRLSENEINLSVANRRFREGDYETAMGIYLLLHQKHPLPFDLYFQNAMMAAQKLGIDSVKTIDELMKRVSFQI